MSFGQGQSVRSNPLRHENVTARRQVFKTDEIPHKWAHQTQEAARNAQGNLYFKGPTIYSYRDSWPLARIYTRKKPVYLQHGSANDRPMRTEALSTLVLTNSNRASVTTSGHQHAVKMAVSHLRAIAVPEVETAYGVHPTPDHSENLEYLNGEMARLHAEAGRAMTESAVAWRAERAAQLHKDMADYMIFFGIRRKLPALLSFAAHYERARRIEHPDPASRDKRERSRAQRRARLTERDEYLAEQQRALQRGAFYRIGAQRTDWRLFGAFGTHAQAWRHEAWRHDGAVILRVNGDEIETSQGARIPLDHAPRIWGVVQKVMARGEPYQHNGHSEHAGDFRIDRIEVDGTLIAGCHTIGYGELCGIARALGLS